MTKGQSDYAKRKALEIFDAWLDVTGCIDRFTGYYYELSGIIEDAVEIGSMTALDVPFEIKDGQLLKSTEDDQQQAPA